MNEELGSIVLGTAGLSVAAMVALLLTLSRKTLSPEPSEARRVRHVAVPGIFLHCLHLTEEWFTGFHVRFPVMLGLAPWPSAFFVSFNVFWIAIWVICLMLLRSQPRVALFPLWFLAIASAANGVAHPLLAVASGGYFPGLWSSPLVGIMGVLLLRTLGSFSRRREAGE